MTFNLKNSTYTTYMKPGNTILYINKSCNHPHLITKYPNKKDKKTTAAYHQTQKFHKAASPYKPPSGPAGTSK